MAKRPDGPKDDTGLSRKRTADLLHRMRRALRDARTLKADIDQAQRDTVEHHAKHVNPERRRRNPRNP